jgi:hypothetical protein
MSETLARSDSLNQAANRAASAPYYLADFMAVVAAVRAQYANHLSADEHRYLARLDALSQPARMLYARLVNRRGPCFRVARLVYPEVGDVEPAIEELVAAGLLERHSGASAPTRLLACFTCPELKAALRGHPVRAFRRPELLAWLGQWDGYGEWIGELLARDGVIGVPASNPFAFLRFLFFGELRDNLSDFVTRALGHVVTETVDPSALRPCFGNRREIDDAYRMAVLYQEFRMLRQGCAAIEILEWWRGHAIRREDLSAGQQWFDRLADRLGRMLEREGQTDAAAKIYAASPVAPSRERHARILIKAGETMKATSLLHEMQGSLSHAEAYAARQLLARLQLRPRRSEARDMQIAGGTLVLDYPPGGVEQAVLAHYRQLGWNGVHSENWLWNASFGLLLWDIIYDPGLGVFHSPFQFAPSDLHHPQFYLRRQPQIEARLAVLAQPACALAIMLENFHAKTGVSNPFVAWHDDLPELLEVMVRLLPAAAHAAALAHLGRNIARHASGLPDLFLWNGTDYRFVEIKAENDHLSGHQFEWLRVLRDAGIAVSVEKVVRPANQPGRLNTSTI